MCSDDAADSHRFMDILDAAIKSKEVRCAAPRPAAMLLVQLLGRRTLA